MSRAKPSMAIIREKSVINDSQPQKSTIAPYPTAATALVIVFWRRHKLRDFRTILRHHY
jgi:hypothetical protein